MATENICVVGVDGGGSKTEAVLVDGYGRAVSWGRGGPSNPNSASEDEMLESLGDAFRGALSGGEDTRAGNIAAICIGGAGSTGNHELLRQLVGRLGYGHNTIVVSDTVIAFWTAISGTVGVVLVAGTGSCAYGVGPDGHTAKAGGWGYLVGDEGSGYAIGRAGIAAALRAHDGRGPSTALLDRLMEFLKLDRVDQVVARLYQPVVSVSRTRIACFAPQVTEAAATGDPVAHEILVVAGGELALSAVAVARRVGLIDREFELGLVGGVFRAGEALTAALADAVESRAPNARVCVCRRSPALGAARLALRSTGRDVIVAEGHD